MDRSYESDGQNYDPGLVTGKNKVEGRVIDVLLWPPHARTWVPEPLYTRVHTHTFYVHETFVEELSLLGYKSINEGKVPSVLLVLSV